MEQTDLPSGTVTFLFTDVELSTQTIAEVGAERYADIQDVHRKLLREAFVAHHGVEVGTEGDAFFVAFARAGDAVAAAVDGQRALAEGSPLRVRIGLHTGEALVRGGDYVGHDVHKAKRISDAGHGRQILLSQATAELVRETVQLVDLGAHRLKDLREPERLHQVVADGLQSEFAPPRSLDVFRHNLPLQRSPFIGREAEIAEARRLLEAHRLVTLTGIGGCGKTRLALQVGAESIDAYPDGVFFVDLAPLADPDAIPATVASAVGVPMRAEDTSALQGTTDQLLLAFLGRRRCLVVMDNCEHLLDACADIADSILTACPDVSLLATSREALDVEGEQSWRVPSLSLPRGGEAHSSEAVSLFKTRAQTVRPDFELTPQNIDSVAEICTRLDGIPLAIEFAASRVSHLSPQEIAARLGDMFKLLAGGPRRRVQRQQTLQAALDWSYELLSRPERVLLQRLAVFPGSFTLAAAEGICSGPDIEQHAVLDLLGSLVAKSLVTLEEHDAATTRYRLIETVRAYAAEKLRVAGEADVYRALHRDWFQAWMRSLDWEELSYPRRRIGYRDEQANLRAAIEWSEAEGRLDLVVSMAARVRWLWTSLGNFEEELRWLTVARPEDLDIDPDERISALHATAFLMNVLQREGSAAFAERAVSASDGRPSIPLARAHVGHAMSLALQSQWVRDPALAERARREIDHAFEMVDPDSEGARNTLASKGTCELVLGDAAAATDALEEATKRGDAVRLDEGPSDIYALLAAAAHIAGQADLALRAARRFLDTSDAGIPGYEGLNRGIYAAPAITLATAGEVDRAKELLRGHITRASHQGRPGVREEIAIGTAAVAYICGDAVRASQLLGWVQSRTFDAGQILPATPAAYALYQHYVPLVRAALTSEDAKRARNEGRAMLEDEAMACALEVVG